MRQLGSEVLAWESIRSPPFLSMVNLPAAEWDFIGFRDFL